MYDELTAVDIQKMQEEINYRVRELRPQLIEEVQTARAFGDLSENYEYKCAKQAKNRNDSRIRYLERMIRTAKVIEVKETADAVGLFDTVTVYNEMMKKEMIVRIVTTLRQDALKGLISKESPVGQALMGSRTGERVEVAVSPEMTYTLEIRKIEKGSEEWQVSMDYWQFIQKYYSPDSTDSWWDEVVKAGESLINKYKGMEIEERARQLVLSHFAWLEITYRKEKPKK